MRVPDRVGMLAAVKRRLGRMSMVAVTAILLSGTLAAAMSLHILLAALGLHEFDLAKLAATAFVTVVAVTPIIVYAQSIIRELLTSRRALRLMTDRLAWALHNAEQANEAKSTFIASMSHELRTPLNAIIGFSDIMANQRLGALENPRYRGYARDINASGAHLLEIINDILDIARIESGKVAIEPDAEIDVARVVASAITIVGPLAERGDVDLKCRLPDAPVGLVAVERMVRQVLINVLSNAVKFTAPGGGVRLGLVLLDDGSLAVTVVDSGIGMSAEDIKVALTPFGQIDSVQARQHEGTGLGLPLARSMMELHGGRLSVESVPGEGTTVKMLFPAERVRPGSATAPDPAAASDAAGLPGRGKRRTVRRQILPGEAECRHVGRQVAAERRAPPTGRPMPAEVWMP